MVLKATDARRENVSKSMALLEEALQNRKSPVIRFLKDLLLKPNDPGLRLFTLLPVILQLQPPKARYLKRSWLPNDILAATPRWSLARSSGSSDLGGRYRHRQ
jgi:hypothetical protein